MQKDKKELTKEELEEIFMNNFDSYAEKAGDDGGELVPTMSCKRYLKVLKMLRETGRL